MDNFCRGNEAISRQHAVAYGDQQSDGQFCRGNGKRFFDDGKPNAMARTGLDIEVVIALQRRADDLQKRAGLQKILVDHVQLRIAG
jgi:hypothetical protein